jgi:integrase
VGDELALLSVAPPHLRTIVVLALDTGLRRGEILGQQRQHIDAHRRVLLVSVSKTAGGTGREIPWTTRVSELLTPLCSGDGPVITYGDAPLRSIKKAWGTAITNAGIRYLRFHDTRHTFNTRLMEAGVSQDVRKALMGHADADINAVYTHVELPAKRRAIEALERWNHEQTAEWQKGAVEHQSDVQPSRNPQESGGADG